MTVSKNIKKIIGLILILSNLVVLISCEAKSGLAGQVESDEYTEHSSGTEAIPPVESAPTVISTPFEIPGLDISPYVYEELPSFDEYYELFDENEIKSSLCIVPDQNLPNVDYVVSEESWLLSGNESKLTFQCTWTYSGTSVYIGLLDEANNIVYVVPSQGGSAKGSINLDFLPEGEYRVILYSGDNQTTLAVLTYQFLNANSQESVKSA